MFGLRENSVWTEGIQSLFGLRENRVFGLRENSVWTEGKQSVWTEGKQCLD